MKTPRITIACLLIFCGSLALAGETQAVIQLKSRVSMQELAAQVTGQLSLRRGRFFTPAEIRDLAGPTATDYANLLNFIASKGLRVVSESPTHLWLTVRGNSTGLSTVARSSAVETVQRRARVNTLAPRAKLLNVIYPGTIQHAYGFDAIYRAGYNGSGQHIAIAAYGGFSSANIQQYFSLLGIAPSPAVTQMPVNGATVFDEDSAVETETDVELAGSLAPGAAIDVFASADNSDIGELQLFTAILDDNLSKIIVYNWGSLESSLDSSHASAMDAVFARAVAQGVNILVASGTGSSAPVPGWPENHPDVIAVGGTTFALTNGILNETAGASVGSQSAIWPLPAWQKELGPSYTGRVTPDVAFNSVVPEPVWTTTAGKGQWLAAGGTSVASAQWAGLLALVGQARAQQGKLPLGYLNPLIYGKSAMEFGLLFHDVTVGSISGIQAGPGWDQLTGWGSPRADGWIK